MEIDTFTPDDADRVQRYVRLSNEVRRVDSPWVHPLTELELVGQLRHGWDGEVPVPFLANDGDTDVAVGGYSTSNYDNLHLAWLDVEVHPEHRRRGHGSALLEHLMARTRAEGRTSVGIGGWEDADPGPFADRHGLGMKAVEVNRRQHFAEVDWPRVEELHREAEAHASAYEIVRRLGCSPDDELEAIAEMAASINDAPTDDLDIEDEVYSAERVRAYEHAQVERGYLLHRVMARHRETGELAGHTVVAVDGERPQLAEQHDTTVVAGHRGHRLGLLLKADLMLWLRESQPQVESVDTWNAASNDHMISVNEALAYRVMGRTFAYQRTLAPSMSTIGLRLTSRSRTERLTEAEMKRIGRLASARLALDSVRFPGLLPTVAVDLVGFTGVVPVELADVVTEVIGDFDTEAFPGAG